MRGSLVSRTRPNVIRCVRRVADQGQFQRRVQLLECFAHQQSIILRLHAADVKKIASLLQTEPVEHRGRFHRHPFPRRKESFPRSVDIAPDNSPRCFAHR